MEDHSSSGTEKWTDAETRLLCETRIAHNHLFTGRTGNSRNAWNTVIRICGEAGLTRSSKSKFKRKWGDTLAYYKKLKYPSQFTTGEGTEDGKDTAQSWDLYSLFDEYHSDRHTLNPPAIADTSAPPPASEDAATGRSSYLLPGDDTITTVVPPNRPIYTPSSATSPITAQPSAPVRIACPTSLTTTTPVPTKFLILKPVITSTTPVQLKLPSTHPTVPPTPISTTPSSAATPPLAPKPITAVSASISQPIPSTSASISQPIPSTSAAASTSAASVPLKCKDFFKDKKQEKGKKPEKGMKQEKEKKQEKVEEFDDWFKSYLQNSEEERRSEHSQLMELLKEATKK